MGTFWYAAIGAALCFMLLAFIGSHYYEKLFHDSRTPHRRDMYINITLCVGFVICFFVAFFTWPLR